MNAPAETVPGPIEALGFRSSSELGELAAALSKAQGVMEPALKGADNPYFNSKYADLGAVMEAVRKPFADNGLSVIQGAFSTEERVEVWTRILHASGQWIESGLSAKPKDMGPQAVGSVITYLRRYGLSGMAGVATEDDDGNAGTKQAGKDGASPEKKKRRAENAAVAAPIETSAPGCISSAQRATLWEKATTLGKRFVPNVNPQEIMRATLDVLQLDKTSNIPEGEYNHALALIEAWHPVVNEPGAQG